MHCLELQHGYGPIRLPRYLKRKDSELEGHHWTAHYRKATGVAEASEGIIIHTYRDEDQIKDASHYLTKKQPKRIYKLLPLLVTACS